MALVQKRLETMRQLTKPQSAVSSQDSKTVYVLLEDDTGHTIGVYTDEETAWLMAEDLMSQFDIEATVEAFELDADVLAYSRRGDYAG